MSQSVVTSVQPGTLYVVATPIGNLDDISARALRILREVALIAAEDTRHSVRLLQHFGIETPLAACHEHNEREQGGRRKRAAVTRAKVADKHAVVIAPRPAADGIGLLLFLCDMEAWYPLPPK